MRKPRENAENRENSMFHEDQALDLPQKPTGAFDIDAMNEGELLSLLSLIHARLPLQLTQLDLEQELLLQYRMTRKLMHEVASDSSVQANQRAQCANSCAAVLEQITKTQTRLYTAERLKRIEQALIKAVKAHLPTEAQEQFFQAYEIIYQQEEGKKQ
jgi:hypothetical protein